MAAGGARTVLFSGVIARAVASGATTSPMNAKKRAAAGCGAYFQSRAQSARILREATAAKADSRRFGDGSSDRVEILGIAKKLTEKRTPACLLRCLPPR